MANGPLGLAGRFLGCCGLVERQNKMVITVFISPFPTDEGKERKAGLRCF